MKLSDVIANDFGVMVTIAFLIGCDGKESSSNIVEISDEYDRIVMDIKKGKTFDGSHFSQNILDLYADGFAMSISLYQQSGMSLPAILEMSARKIVDNATYSELRYCKDTLDNFVNMIAVLLQRSEFVHAFSKISNLLVR